MKHNVAEIIGMKARALKHCTKILGIVDREGKVNIKIGATGLVLPCEKHDAVHTLLQSERAKLIHEINSIEITAGLKRMTPRALPAPVGACSTRICTICGKEFAPKTVRHTVCSDECRAEKGRRYAREYYKRTSAEK